MGELMAAAEHDEMLQDIDTALDELFTAVTTNDVDMTTFYENMGQILATLEPVVNIDEHPVGKEPEHEGSMGKQLDQVVYCSIKMQLDQVVYYIIKILQMNQVLYQC